MNCKDLNEAKKPRWLTLHIFQIINRTNKMIGDHSGVVIEGISIKNCHGSTNGGAIFIAGTPHRYDGTLDTSIYFDDEEDSEEFEEIEAEDMMDDKTKITVDWIHNFISELKDYNPGVEHITLRDLRISNCSAIVGGGITTAHARVVVEVRSRV